MMRETLNISINEKDVENTYRHNFLKKFKDMEITSPFGCDGFGVSKSSKVRTLMEFKDNINLSNKSDLVKVLTQSVFYIKRFYDKGIIPPSTIFIGDRNECLTLHVNDVIKYLEMDLNWSVPPSSAHTISDLFLAMMKDENIKPFVYDSEHFLDCIQKVKDLTDNVQRKVLVTDKNITEVFRYFDEKVLIKNKFTTNERANLFVQILVNKDDNYLHPVKKRKTVVSKSLGEVPVVTREAFEAFFNHFSSSYTPSQKHKLAAVVDRIVEDTTRRKQGEFFTPAIWVDKAHEYIASVYGEDWKEKYIVWDPAWGTGNLTRDYKFKELYVSTLNQSDIDTANQMGYNSEAVKFQYDFLNDDYEKLPVGLRNAIESGKEIIVLMNPPYATSKSSKGGNKIESKIGVAKNKINDEMTRIALGNASRQLYCQFIYRLSKLSSKIHITLFSPPSFLTSSTFEKYRTEIISCYSFEDGFIMNSKEFSDVSSWTLSFSILSSNSIVKKIQPKFFLYDILVSKDFTVEKIGEKVLHSISKSEKASEWVKLNKQHSITFPNLSSSMVVGKTDKKIGVLPENYLGCFCNGSNNVEKNEDECTILSAPYTGNIGFDITSDNFWKVIPLFGGRKIISDENWITHKDEYFIPQENNEHFEVFRNDSLIISLFDTHASSSSLRQIEYKDQLWDIKNEFFWMSVEKMKELADQNGYDELYNDARTSSDRYVHKLLFGEERIYDRLSPDAKAVLDKATELVERSMELRQVMANDENHLNSWDAGYAQLKLVWKEYFQEEFKEFRQLYKALEDRMRPLVYELGFLKK